MAQTPEGEAGPTGAPQAPDHDLLQLVLSLLSESAPDSQDGNGMREQNRRLRSALSQMMSVLRDKSTMCITLERKVDALGVQVASLKEVASLTRDLLQIRNTEVEHLQQDMNSIQGKMAEQRASHNEVVAKLDRALTLNDLLKQEYETQLKLFQGLKEKYEQRAALMDTINNSSKTDSTS